MKRFWKLAAVEPETGGWAVALDGKRIRTPASRPLLVPGKALATAIAGEWNAIGDTVDPRAMPLTGLANAAIDRVAPDPQAFASGLAKYAQADLACYRAEGPPELLARQEQAWDEILAWGRRRFDVDFATTCEITHVPQPANTVERLSRAVSALDPYRLAGLSPLVTIGGSLLFALAVLDREVAADTAWKAVTIDEQWQSEKWGADAEAEAALEQRKRDFLAAARFLDLLDDQ